MDKYYSDLVTAINQIDQQQLDNVESVLREAYESQSTVYLMGNGGSASTSEHISCDLLQVGFKAIALTTTPILTANGNDYGYAHIFSNQLRNYRLKPNELVIIISGSGKSPNILSALEYAREVGAKTIGFLGDGGGLALEKVDFPILTPSWNYGIVEDLHLSLGHYFAQRFRGDENIIRH